MKQQENVFEWTDPLNILSQARESHLSQVLDPHSSVSGHDISVGFGLSGQKENIVWFLMQLLASDG